MSNTEQQEWEPIQVVMTYDQWVGLTQKPEPESITPRQVRKDYGLSQKDFAEKIGLSRSTYITREKYPDTWRYVELELIAYHFGASYEALMRGVMNEILSSEEGI